MVPHFRIIPNLFSIRYQTQCNKRNKKQTNLTELCEGNFEIMTYTTDQHTHSPRWCYLLRHAYCLVIFGYIKAYLNRLYSHNICHVIISEFMYSSHIHMWRSFVCVGYHVGLFHVRELSCGGVSCA